MNINNAFPSKYFKSADVESGDIVLTISHVEMEDVGIGGDSELKPVVYFEGADKGLVLNKTNSDTITKLVGTAETDEWKGQLISLYATEVGFQGKQMLGLRVRTRPPAATGTAKHVAVAKDAREVAFDKFKAAGAKLTNLVKELRADASLNDNDKQAVADIAATLQAHRVPTDTMDADELNERAGKLEGLCQKAASMQVPF